jgi:hypothetical protein
VHYISFNSSSYKKSRDLNDRNYVLNLPIRIKICVRSRLHNGNKKIRSGTLFFRLNGILPANGLIKEKVKPIPTKEII